MASSLTHSKFHCYGCVEMYERAIPNSQELPIKITLVYRAGPDIYCQQGLHNSYGLLLSPCKMYLYMLPETKTDTAQCLHLT